jgi:hypothetical protein
MVTSLLLPARRGLDSTEDGVIRNDIPDDEAPRTELLPAFLSILEFRGKHLTRDQLTLTLSLLYFDTSSRTERHRLEKESLHGKGITGITRRIGHGTS